MFYHNVLKTSERRILNTTPFQTHCKTFWKRLVFAGTRQKLSNKIPITQATYRANRSTTENVFTITVLAKKAITSKDYETHLLMLDMSKAFDTFQRKSLFDELQEILSENEVYMLYILINDVNVNVRC